MTVRIQKFVNYKEQVCRLGKLEWSVARLISLSRGLPVFELPLMHLNIYYKYPSMSLRELSGHIKSVNNADLAFPIILDEDGEIMDGRHRVIKALLSNAGTVKAVRFQENPSPCKSYEDEE